METVLLRDTAYNAFKNSLFTERLQPGQFLSLKEICTVLDVSLSPLRDALRQLESEGLVELLPQRGVRIANVDRKFIRNAFQVRRFLEVQACLDLEAMGGWPELAEIRERTMSIATRAENGVDATLKAEALEVDWAFHDGLIALMQNEILSDIHRQSSDKIKIIRLNPRFTSGRVLPAMREHLAIIDAISEEDYVNAAAAMNKHLFVSEQRALGRKPGDV
jgi:DNA-binding GntR family transcriptional regulator